LYKNNKNILHFDFKTSNTKKKEQFALLNAGKKQSLF